MGWRWADSGQRSKRGSSTSRHHDTEYCRVAKLHKARVRDDFEERIYKGETEHRYGLVGAFLRTRREYFLHFRQFKHGGEGGIGLHFIHRFVALIFCFAQIDKAALEI